MLSVVIAIHLMLVLAMIGVVLLQKSEGGGLVSSSSGSGFLTGRGTANVLTRTTALLAAGFFITSLALSLLAAHSRGPVSLIPASGPTQEAPAPNAPPPTVPLNSGSNGLLNQLGGGAGNSPPANAPAAPSPAPAPAGPQVPQSH